MNSVTWYGECFEGKSKTTRPRQRSTAVKRTIFLIIAVFLLGLLTVVSVSTWELMVIRNSISAEREGSVALYRLGGRAHKEVQAIEKSVVNLFKASSSTNLDAARKILEQHLTAFTDVVTAIQEPRFKAQLSSQVKSADGSNSEPLQKAVDVLATGVHDLRSGVTQVVELAGVRLDLHTKMVSVKTDLSKVARKTFALNAVDAKAYNNLMRGAIATVSTDSAADLKFVGLKIYEDGYGAFTKAQLNDEQKALLNEFNTQYLATYEVVRQYLSTGSDAEFFERLAQNQLTALTTLVNGSEMYFDHGQETLAAKATATITTSLALAGGIAVICLVLGFFVAGRLTRPLSRTVARMSVVSNAIEGGDLTARVEHSGKDEVSAMAKAINSTLDQLGKAMTSIGTSVRSLSSRSDQLNDISSKLDESSGKASAKATELSATAQQVSASIQSVSAGIEEFSAGVNEIAKSTGEAASIGREAMEQARSAEKTMEELSHASQQIGSIIAVIETITAQTKLLALNATIEAARAGDAGRGFAVVANEVKTLATQTASAAGDVHAQIEAIRQKSNMVSGAIKTVVATIDRVNNFQQSIAGAVEEQAATTRELASHLSHAATGGSEIAKSVSEVASGAKSNSSHASTVLATAKDLSTTTTELNGFVGRFRF
jgi:methyl-accepting chemotaxis protein